jgi:ABC-2 type transport system ATP-binding protein
MRRQNAYVVAKTTTIRMLLGLIRPTAGGGSILGGSLADPASYLARVGALIESPAFYPQLSGRDNLKALARVGGIPDSAIGPALDRTGWPPARATSTAPTPSA